MSRPGSSWRTEDMDPTCQGSPTTHILTISLHHLATASHASNRFLIDQSLSTTTSSSWPHPWPHPYIMTNTHLFVQVLSCKLKFQHGGVLRHLFCSHLVNTHTTYTYIHIPIQVCNFKHVNTIQLKKAVQVFWLLLQLKSNNVIPLSPLFFSFHFYWSWQSNYVRW